MTRRRIGEVEVQLHTFLTSTLVGGEWSASRPGRFAPERTPGSHRIEVGWAQIRSGRCGEEKNSQPPPGIETLNTKRC